MCESIEEMTERDHRRSVVGFETPPLDSWIEKRRFVIPVNPPEVYPPLEGGQEPESRPKARGGPMNLDSGFRRSDAADEGAVEFDSWSQERQLRSVLCTTA